MAGDNKTEEATPRRRQKEREKGNISKSQDLNSAVTICAGCALMIFLASKIINNTRELMYYTVTHLNPKEIPSDDIIAVLVPFAKGTGDILLPFLLALAVLTALSLRLQVGALFAIEKLKPSLDKLKPSSIINGLKKTLNPFAVKNMVELLKSLAKMSVVAYAGFSVLFARKDELYGLMGANIDTGFAVLGSVLTQMIITICIAMLVIGFIDKKYQDYEYNKSLKMTKQEVKDEWKNTEGDPLIKSKIKSAQMQFAQQRMMSAIPKSDVVVVNPTHYAVAIRYDKSEAPAPKVVAKGVDFLAFKIREVAKHNDIPIVENPPLARALYKLVKIDSIIPAELYVAVAEILAFVYNKNKSGV
ncbi:flagellar biosynthesis protein FlhB [bacterium]|nr:flagellar biosynthesis protein FlhB [bacterium]